MLRNSTGLSTPSQNVRTLKNKYDLTLCKSRLHIDLENFVHHKKIQTRLDFLRFRIRSKHFDRKWWWIQKKKKTYKNFWLGVQGP